MNQEKSDPNQQPLLDDEQSKQVNDRLDAMSAEIERLLSQVGEVQELRAENAALKEQIKGREVRLTREQTTAKVARLRAKSRMKPLKGKKHWLFQLIIPGHFNKDGSPVVMKHTFHWYSQSETKAEALAEMNAHNQWTFKESEVVARGVGFVPTDAEKATEEKKIEEQISVPV